MEKTSEEVIVFMQLKSNKFDWSAQDRQLLTDFAKYKSEVEELKAKYGNPLQAGLCMIIYDMIFA
jgi:hypothetical protein